MNLVERPFLREKASLFTKTKNWTGCNDAKKVLPCVVQHSLAPVISLLAYYTIICVHAVWHHRGSCFSLGMNFIVWWFTVIQHMTTKWKLDFCLLLIHNNCCICCNCIFACKCQKWTHRDASLLWKVTFKKKASCTVETGYSDIKMFFVRLLCGSISLLAVCYHHLNMCSLVTAGTACCILWFKHHILHVYSMDIGVFLLPMDSLWRLHCSIML